MTEYLKEDEDIVSQIEGPNSLDMDFLLKRLQIKATLRNRKSLVDSSKETKVFSIVLITFALIQFVVALFQFLFSVVISDNKIYGIFSFVIICLFSWYVFNRTEKINK
jgi:hypothetical protein